MAGGIGYFISISPCGNGCHVMHVPSNTRCVLVTATFHNMRRCAPTLAFLVSLYSSLNSE